MFPGRREACNEGEGDPPLYVNVNMYTGQLMNTWIDSLQAFFPGLQVNAPSAPKLVLVLGWQRVGTVLS